MLRGISVDVRPGEVVSIIGPSGSGKSTFLRCLNRLEEPTSGSILFKGEDITKKKNIAAYRQRIGMVFQNFNVFPHMNVIDNITLTQESGVYEYPVFEDNSFKNWVLYNSPAADYNENLKVDASEAAKVTDCR